MQRFCVTRGGEALQDHGIVLFVGNYDECIDYMRTHDNWDDLKYCSITKDGQVMQGRVSSYAL